jgi:hypothetical protein
MNISLLSFMKITFLTQNQITKNSFFIFLLIGFIEEIILFSRRIRKCNNPEPQGIGFSCRGTLTEVQPCLQEELCGKLANY